MTKQGRGCSQGKVDEGWGGKKSLVQEGKVEVCDPRMEGKSLMKELGWGYIEKKSEKKCCCCRRRG